ncbi:LytTR family transcriptional regulator, partial [bacterium]|nr:LytTR family transcriptional regulator [bacterium]
MDVGFFDQNCRINISVCQIEHKTETLIYAGAGTSIIIEDNNNCRKSFKGKNKALEADRAGKNIRYLEEKIKIKTGHRIFLFGNGIINLLGDNENQGLGLERLKSFLESSTSEDFETRKEKISEGLSRLSGSSENGSDITLIGLRYKKPSIQDRRRNRGERRKNISDRSIMEVMYQISTNLNDILYIKTESPYCRIFFRSQKSSPKLLRTTLHSIEFHFKSKDLLRVHRSYLINPKSVLSAFQKNREHSVLLKGKRKNIVIPIGRSYYKKLSETYPEFFI